MELTQQIREVGMQEKSVEFRKAGDLYVKNQTTSDQRPTSNYQLPTDYELPTS
jgi:hypothetical protein